ncbi:ferredoxin [Streptomyces sp. CA-132043]|uniref:ferredoxin n=1 Tax=Streptomyces sp. CA-132043 TaxID=3240048 RepID=UPI003D8BFCE9
MRIDVDRERCVGSGACVHARPDLFDQSERDGRVVLLAAEPAGEVGPVTEVCPVAAISLVAD